MVIAKCNPINQNGYRELVLIETTLRRTPLSNVVIGALWETFRIIRGNQDT
jgi:hypothetical protein